MGPEVKIIYKFGKYEEEVSCEQCEYKSNCYFNQELKESFKSFENHHFGCISFQHKDFIAINHTEELRKLYAKEIVHLSIAKEILGENVSRGLLWVVRRRGIIPLDNYYLLREKNDVV